MPSRMPPADSDATEVLVTQLSESAPVPGTGVAPGTRLGRYRLETLLGWGGMGEVYRAEQLEPVRRTVAIKLLRGQRLEARHLAYFEVERQLLAQMRHPAIAQIYDAGATADGVPFLAMEYSEGQPVTQFCRAQALSLRERLQLFILICEGVQHAHHKGVIHRDLKPGNLLVDRIDGRAAPKIIDFGIATMATRALSAPQERAGTPDYMSPEQAQGDPAAIDTRSDVYALGVLLHELLVGVRPGHADEDRARPLPSTHLSRLASGEALEQARGQGMNITRLQRVLQDELDWVVAKAMQPEREERYASVAELAADLRRFLGGEPLMAVPPTRRYRATKFFARHRTAFIAATLVACALLAGLGLSLYGLMQAREQRALAELRSRELERVAGFQQSMLEGIDIEAMGSGLANGLREQLAGRDPALRATLEDLLAQTSSSDVARRMIDRELLANAEVAIARDFAAQPALASGLRASIARVYAALGLSKEAALRFRQVARFHAAQSGQGDAATLDARLGEAENLLAAAEVEPAAKVITRALPMAYALPVDHPVRVGLEIAQANVIAAQGDRERAKGMLQTVYERLRQQAGERNPVTLDALNVWADQQRAVGEIAEARINMEKLVPLRMAVQGAEHKDTLAALGNLAVMRMMTGEKEGAVTLQRQLVATQVRRLGAEHPVALHARGTLASMLADSGGAEEALLLGKEVIAGRERVLGPEHPQTLRARVTLATTYARLEDFKSALPLEKQVLHARRRLLGPNHPDTLSVQINHAGTLLHDGQPQAALDQLSQALPLARDVLGLKHPQTQRALLIRADALMDLGSGSEAIAAYRDLVDARRRLLGEDHPETLRAVWSLVQAHEDLGRQAEAATLRTRYLQPLLDADPDALSEPLAALAGAIREQRPPSGHR